MGEPMKTILAAIVGLCLLLSAAQVQAQATCPPNGLILQSTMIATADSEAGFWAGPPAEGPARLAIDGDQTSLWRTVYSPSQAPLPHYITLDLGASYITHGLTYLPRQDGGLAGYIGDFAVDVSSDNVSFQTVATGTWAGTNAPKPASWANTTAKYVKLRALSDTSGQQQTIAAEINIQCANPPPVVTQTINLEWAGQGPGNTYNLKQSIDNGVNWTPLKTGLTTPFTQADVPNSGLVLIRVTAVKGTVESPIPNAGIYVFGTVNLSPGMGVN